MRPPAAAVWGKCSSRHISSPCWPDCLLLACLLARSLEQLVIGGTADISDPGVLTNKQHHAHHQPLFSPVVALGTPLGIDQCARPVLERAFIRHASTALGAARQCHESLQKQRPFPTSFSFLSHPCSSSSRAERMRRLVGER